MDICNYTYKNTYKKMTNKNLVSYYSFVLKHKLDEKLSPKKFEKELEIRN